MSSQTVLGRPRSCPRVMYSRPLLEKVVWDRIIARLYVEILFPQHVRRS